MFAFSLLLMVFKRCQTLVKSSFITFERSLFFDRLMAYLLEESALVFAKSGTWPANTNRLCSFLDDNFLNLLIWSNKKHGRVTCHRQLVFLDIKGFLVHFRSKVDSLDFSLGVFK